jgi:hypothetical protein
MTESRERSWGLAGAEWPVEVGSDQLLERVRPPSSSEACCGGPEEDIGGRGRKEAPVDRERVLRQHDGYA